MVIKDALDTLRAQLHTAMTVDVVADVGAPKMASWPITLLVSAARNQRDARLKTVGTAPEWLSLSGINGGAAGVSLLFDVVGLATEFGIRSLGKGGVDLNRNAHAFVDLWTKCEAGRALLVELFELWPGGAPTERVHALRTAVDAICSDFMARAFELSLDLKQISEFMIEMGVGEVPAYQ